jgi:hypothetical protein
VHQLLTKHSQLLVLLQTPLLQTLPQLVEVPPIKKPLPFKPR